MVSRVRRVADLTRAVQRIQVNAAVAARLQGLGLADLLRRYGLSAADYAAPMSSRYSRLKPFRVAFFVRLDRELRAVVDPRWYRDANLGSSRLQDPCDHFIETGLARGLRPNGFVDLTEVDSIARILVSDDPGQFSVGSAFSLSGYLENNRDVERSGLNPLYHFMAFGRAEGRSPTPSPLAQSSEVRLIETLSPAGKCVGFELHGFAVVEDLSSLEVLLDGTPIGNARICVPSPESVRKFTGASGLDGFFFKIDEIEPGADAEVLLRARDLSGDVHEIATALLNRSDHAEKLPPLRFTDDSWRHQDARGRSDRRRLVVFTHDLGLGGGQLYLQEILRGLKDIPDLDVLVMSFAGGPLVAELQEYGFTVRIADGPNVDSGIDYEEFLDSLNEQMLEFSPEYVLANTLGCFAHSDWASRVGIAQTWFVHESYSRSGWSRAAFGRPISPYVQQQIADALGRAESVVFEAQATLDLVMDGLENPGAEFLRYGVEIANQSELEAFRGGRARMNARLKISGQKRVFITVGTFEHRKAIGAVVRAARTLKDRGVEADFILVGAVSGTAYTEQIRRSVKELGLTGSIRLVNVTSNWLEYLQCADYFFLPSDLESMPQSMMIAMSYAIPAIGARVFGVPELISDGDTGFLHEPNDVADITRVLEGAIMLSGEELTGMGQRARAYVSEHHDLRTYVSLVRDRVLAETGPVAGGPEPVDGLLVQNG